MFQFFRRYQQYIYVVITVVIIISFSFFGTYGAINQPMAAKDQSKAFTSVDGNDISSSDLEAMTLFISSDAKDKKNAAGAWGPNFLNDGVFVQEFLDSGLMNNFAQAFTHAAKKELIAQHQLEKNFRLYRHPDPSLRNISIEAVWERFKPELRAHYHALKNASDPLSAKAMNARINLYLSSRELPPETIKMLLLYMPQFQQHPDPSLQQQDLALFSYHNAQDWFGKRLMRLAAEFIINTAAIAKKAGYTVTAEEAWIDLTRNASESFHDNRQVLARYGIGSSALYLKQQLQLMGLDQASATKIWQQILLFRRYINDVKNAVLVPPLSVAGYQQFAKASVEGDLFRLPPSLRFYEKESLYQFQTYLEAVSKPQKNPLILPDTFLEPSIVIKTTPELVQQRYMLSVSSVSKDQLKARIPLKDTWAWELEESNWQLLQEEFPTIGISDAKSTQDRLATLDALDSDTRTHVDQFARSKILEAHPEWIQEALDNAVPQQAIYTITESGGKEPLAGVADRKKLLKELAKAKKNETPHPISPLFAYSGDGSHFHRIIVIDAAEAEEVMTFSQAQQSGAIGTVLEKNLKNHYEQLKKTAPKKLKKADGDWKTFAEAREIVAEDLFSPIVKAIAADYNKSNENEKKSHHFSANEAAALRFFHYMQEKLKLLSKSPDAAGDLTQKPSNSDAIETLDAPKPLKEL